MNPEDVPQALIDKVVRARYAAEREAMAARGVTWPAYDEVIAKADPHSDWFEDDKRGVREILALAWEDIRSSDEEEPHCCGM